MKQTFGKGLESLIPNKIQKINSESIRREESIFYVNIDKIKSNPFQPRKEFDSVALNSLAESIREYGILQPLVVSKTEKASSQGRTIIAEYQLIAGERRLMASRIAGLKEVPVVIRRPTDKEKLEISLIENIQRQDLNPMEKAEAFDRLQKEFNLTHAKIGEMAGISRTAVTNYIRFLGFSDDIKQALRENKITEGLGRAILMTKNIDDRRFILKKILEENLNVREAEHLARKINISQPNIKIKGDIIQELRDLELKIRDFFGVSAKTINLRLVDGRPKLTIFFNSRKYVEDLINDLTKTKLS